jgi:outer membrane receptor protein involved in Fe transport
VRRELDPSGPQEMRFVLEPFSLREEVVVSAEGTPTEIGETPASIVSVNRTQIETSAAPVIDDILRQTAGFSLFRRTDSRTANPTTQGASLRGLNPSGASRAAVLLDSVPLNDPFGGWVPWSSVPPISIEQIEALRGGASGLYGSDSISGAISIIPRKVRRKFAFSAESFGGTQQTGSVSAFGGTANRSFAFDGFASFFNTGGYIPVEESARGTADQTAGSRNTNVSIRFAPALPGKINFFVRGSYFDEARRNGTRLQRNETHARRFVAGADPEIGDPFPGTSNSSLSVRVFGLVQVYDQTFSAVADDRNIEALVRLQRVPSQDLGFSVRFSTAAGRHFVLAGIEGSQTRGSSDETGYFSGNATSKSGSGGRERNFGAYLQDRFRTGVRFTVTGRVRIDRWRNYRALRSDLSIGTGQTTETVFPDRGETAVSPGIAFNFAISSRLSAYVNAGGNFRAPTLNELYRGFRVGNIVTLSNEDLRSERALNVEGGVAFWLGRFAFRAGGYQNAVRDAVSNVTIDADSSPILRQRRNASRITVRGFEIDGQLRLSRIDITFGYLLSEATVTRFPEDPGLVGKRLPQSPAQQFTLRSLFRVTDDISAGVQARASSGQFEDDLNETRLDGYLQADVFAAKRFGRIEAFGSIENLFNSRYAVGLTPVPTVSRPLTFRAGLRWN